MGLAFRTDLTIRLECDGEHRLFPGDTLELPAGSINGQLHEARRRGWTLWATRNGDVAHLGPCCSRARRITSHEQV